MVLSPRRVRERERRAERIFEEMMAENFPNLMKCMSINIQGAQESPSKMKAKRPTPRDIVIKLSKAKDKGS